MSVMASQIIDNSDVCSLVILTSTTQKYQRPALLTFCEENQAMTGRLPSQRASYANSIYIPWRHLVTSHKISRPVGAYKNIAVYHRYRIAVCNYRMLLWKTYWHGDDCLQLFLFMAQRRVHRVISPREDKFINKEGIDGLATSRPIWSIFFLMTVTRCTLRNIIHHIIHTLVVTYVLMPIWGQSICNLDDDARRFRNTQRNALPFDHSYLRYFIKYVWFFISLLFNNVTTMLSYVYHLEWHSLFCLIK